MVARPEKVDVVIVGAGAAGAYLARRLAEAGKRVVVLEAGPRWRVQDLASSQIWARRLRWGGPPVESAGDHPFGYGFNGGWGTGGAALHHYGTWPRMHAEDFKVKTLYGRGLDWPIGYDDLRPFYDRVQAEAGLSGDAEAEIWRPPGAPYPLPPLRTFAQADVLARGFAASDLHTAPAPMAILSEAYDGRPPCLYEGWCDAGCPVGALYNPLVKDLPGAAAAGAEIRTEAQVVRVVAEGRRRVRAVAYREARGAIRVQEADLVILAASAVHNPAILLNSASRDWPEGLANSSGLVGRYFMSHAVTGVYGLFAEETEPGRGVSGAQLTCRDGYGKDAAGTPFGSYQWLVAPAMKPNDLLGIAASRPGLYGDALTRFMERASRHIAGMLAFCESLPAPENRITLAGARDENGLRRVRIEHAFSDEALALAEHARVEGRRVIAAAGANEVWAGATATAHMMGGTIMGADPARSVADSYGRTHDLPNLVVAGPGLFPAGGAVNPTFTLYALALRSAEHMLAHWSDYTLGR